MIVDDAELSPWGKVQVGDLGNEVCEFCDCSMMSRFGGIIGTNECDSCRDEFKRLNEAGKLEWG